MKDGKIIIYLSGPMSGYAEYNYPEFNRVTKILRDAGFIVINPVELDNKEFLATNPEWSDYLKRDLSGLMQSNVDMIVLLDGWYESRGSRAEVFIGQEILSAKIAKFREVNSPYCKFNLEPINVDIEFRTDEVA